MVKINGKLYKPGEEVPKIIQMIDEPPAPTQYGYSPEPKPTIYTQEQLEQIAQSENGRKDLFAIADSYGLEYASNIPTARLIDQILAYQNPTR